MLNSVIIGAGLMGCHHARASSRASAVIVAVIDHDLSAAERLARGFRGCIAARSIDDVVDKVSFDVAHICTPSATHASIALAVAEAGAHALIEKPVGHNAQELERISRGFAAAGRSFCPVHQYAFQTAFEKAITSARGLNALVRFECDIRSTGGPEKMIGRDSCTADILPHPLSLLQRLRPDTEIDKLAWHLSRPSPGEWLCLASLDGGALAKFSISLTARPTCFRSRIVAASGEIEIDHFNGSTITVTGSASRSYKLMQPFDRNGRGLARAATNLGRRILEREWGYPGLLELVCQFYSAIASGRPMAHPIRAEEALAVARTRDLMLLKALQIGSGGHG